MTFELGSFQSLGDAFAARVALHPGKTALTVFHGSDADHDSLTYAELGRRAAVRAAGLADRLAPGERVLMALPTCTEFVEVYLACLLAGLVAVPAPPPTGSTAAAGRVAAMARDCTPGLVLTSGADLGTITDWCQAQGLGHLPVEEAVPVAAGAAAPLRVDARRVNRDALAVLQYSSGSTGAPKGVMLTHANVQTNIAGMQAAVGCGDDDAFGGWMPLHHDFGLFLQVTCAIMCGAPTVLMSPSSFVRRPVEWLRMVSRFRTTATAAPNFAYDLCVRLITDEQLDGVDLSSLRWVANGAEPIRASTMAAFAKRFAGVGLRPEALTPGYGMAEVTLYVSTSPLSTQPRILVADRRRLEDAKYPALVTTTGGAGREIVGVGTPTLFDSRIVDPLTRRALPDHAIGELWLSGDSVGQGYWDKPELSAHAVRACLADDPDPDRTWLRSGDLAAIVDGELFITGRLKEVLIVRGRNLFPHDLEHEARAADPALEGLVGAAFSVDAPDERVVLVHEVGPRVAAEDLPAVAAAVVRRLTTSFGVPVCNVLLVRRGTVRRTTSGKVQRGAMRDQFLAGDIAALHTDLQPEVRRLVGAA